MTLALFKLESFSNAVAARGTEVTFTQDDVDQAFIDGVTQARAEAQDDQMRQLGDGLTRLADELTADESRRSHLRRDAVQALAPILHQILDLMAAPGASRRLQQALTDELTRLAERAAPLSAQIACGAALRPMVQQCLTEAGLEGIEITPLATDRITVTLQGGRIEFDPDSTARDIRALITEITQEDGTWTH